PPWAGGKGKLGARTRIRSGPPGAATARVGRSSAAGSRLPPAAAVTSTDVTPPLTARAAHGGRHPRRGAPTWRAAPDTASPPRTDGPPPPAGRGREGRRGRTATRPRPGHGGR